MKKIRQLEPEGEHKCSSRREGDWIIWECPECDYVRRFNFKTQKVEVRGGDFLVKHSGSSTPKVWNFLRFFNPN